ncbi:MAG: hypothetical protein K8W52_23435 [Deltaproteobacteria bacterium]|nr:hypothetical protein [Deltaproteobacteria bacterium]
MPAPRPTPAPAPMSSMILGCDAACAHADLGTLAHHTELLSLCVAEPLRRELLDVARSCHDDAAHAPSRWYAARDHLRAELREVDPVLHPSA